MRREKKVNYLPKIIYNTTWNGDNITAEMEPLDRSTFLSVTANKPRDGRSFLEGFDDAIKVLEKHLTAVTGAVDSANQPIPKEVILSKVYFSELVIELFKALIEASHVGKVLNSGSEEKSPAGTTAAS